MDVMRTVYLPPDVDDEIRILAFRAGKRKSEVMLDLIQLGLAMKEYAREGKK